MRLHPWQVDPPVAPSLWLATAAFMRAWLYVSAARNWSWPALLRRKCVDTAASRYRLNWCRLSSRVVRTAWMARLRASAQSAVKGVISSIACSQAAVV